MSAVLGIQIQFILRKLSLRIKLTGGLKLLQIGSLDYGVYDAKHIAYISKMDLQTVFNSTQISLIFSNHLSVKV